MTEAIEQLARALAAENDGIDQWEHKSEDGDGYGYLGKNDFRAMARAGLPVALSIGDTIDSIRDEDVRRAVQLMISLGYKVEAPDLRTSRTPQS
jgi:hypothetical protein